jgi:hypothetical protein
MNMGFSALYGSESRRFNALAMGAVNFLFIFTSYKTVLDSFLKTEFLDYSF